MVHLHSLRNGIFYYQITIVLYWRFSTIFKATQIYWKNQVCKILWPKYIRVVLKCIANIKQ